MKFPVPVTLLVFAAPAWAQPAFYQPFQQVQQYLQLTDSQVQTILTNNSDYNQVAMTKQNRISQLQTEIATETSKDTLDPMALGTRYAEIETICRDLKSQAGTYQQKNTSVLTDPQKANLQALQDAVKLAPVISEAQSGNLLGTAAAAPLLFASTSASFGSSNAVIGSFLGPIVSGCYSGFTTSIVRTGDFSGTARPGNLIPATRLSGSDRR